MWSIDQLAKHIARVQDWSPKCNANGAKNVTYVNLARCQVVDVVFSYAYAKIGRIGLVESATETAPKPPEFGSTGEYWGITAGWCG